MPALRYHQGKGVVLPVCVFKPGNQVLTWVLHACLRLFASSACHACNFDSLQQPQNRRAYKQQTPDLIEGTVEVYSHHADHATLLQDAVMRLCHGPAALFTMEAAVKAIAEFLTNLPQDCGAAPAEGLSWVTSCTLTAAFSTSMREA